MAEITRTTSSAQIWITRGHLAALAVATGAIAVLAFLVGLQIGRGNRSGPDTTDAPASAAFLPDASDEDALEALLREVELAQPKSADAPQPTLTPGATTEVAPMLDPSPAPPPSAAGTASSSAWVVQIASYQDADQADAQVARLVEQDISAYRVAGLVSGTTWYRVRVGGYRTKDAATKALDSLESQLGLNDFMVIATP